MTERVRISACIIAKDEVDRIEACLASVGFCDEILVLDSGSTDGTQDLVRRLGARLIETDWPGWVKQKNRAVEAARHEWILSLDADERVDAELRAALEDLREGALGRADAPQAYAVRRKVFYLGRWIRHGGWYPEWRTRLFSRTHARWGGVDPHDKVEADGAVGRIRAGHLEHFTYRSMQDQLNQIARFSRARAEAMYAGGARASIAGMLLRPTWRFFHNYVLRLGLLDGRAGYVLAKINAHYVFMKYAQLWELVRRGGAEGAP